MSPRRTEYRPRLASRAPPDHELLLNTTIPFNSPTPTHHFSPDQGRRPQHGYRKNRSTFKIVLNYERQSRHRRWLTSRCSKRSPINFKDESGYLVAIEMKKRQSKLHPYTCNPSRHEDDIEDRWHTLESVDPTPPGRKLVHRIASSNKQSNCRSEFIAVTRLEEFR